jgi:hypothetical protein
MKDLRRPSLVCSYKVKVALSVQREVCICNKVSVSADRLSTHTNFKNKWLLIYYIIINQLTTIWIEMTILYKPEISTAGHYEPEISDHFFLKFVCVDNRSALTLTLLQMHTSLCTESATFTLYEQTRDHCSNLVNNNIVLLRDVFSYWPSYRSEACCIGLRRSRTPIQQTEDL